MGVLLEEIIDQERAGMLAESALMGHLLPIVALNDIALLSQIPTQARWRAPATITPLDAGSPSSGWVLDCPKFNYRSFWVETADDDYRSHYLAFLRQRQGYGFNHLSTTYDVDHLYNRDRAKMYGYKYIRTFLIQYSPNRSHGAGYEASIGESEALRRVSDIRKMDEVGFMKFMGVKSPRGNKPLTDAQKAHLMAVATMTGLSYEELLRNVTELMAKARSSWASA
jgi:hypothetical protein